MTVLEILVTLALGSSLLLLEQSSEIWRENVTALSVSGAVDGNTYRVDQNAQRWAPARGRWRGT